MRKSKPFPQHGKYRECYKCGKIVILKRRDGMRDGIKTTTYSMRCKRCKTYWEKTYFDYKNPKSDTPLVSVSLE